MIQWWVAGLENLQLQVQHPVSLLFDVIADLPEGIAVTPVFAANKEEALRVGKELFPGHRVTVVLKDGEPGT